MNEYKYQDIMIGLEESFSVRVTEEMMQNFRNTTLDNNPLHISDQFANEGGYQARVVYGMLTASFLSTLAGMYLPGKYSLIQSVQVDFVKPVFVNDVLSVSGKVVEKNDLFKVFTMKITIRNQNEQKVCRGKMQIGVSE